MLVREICLGNSLTVGTWRITLGAISGDRRVVQLCSDLPDPVRPWLRHRHVKLIEVAVGECFSLPNGVVVQVVSAKRKTIKLGLTSPKRFAIRNVPYRRALQRPWG
jgi:hypothetical protein